MIINDSFFIKPVNSTDKTVSLVDATGIVYGILSPLDIAGVYVDANKIIIKTISDNKRYVLEFTNHSIARVSLSVLQQALSKVRDNTPSSGGGTSYLTTVYGKGLNTINDGDLGTDIIFNGILPLKNSTVNMYVGSLKIHLQEDKNGSAFIANPSNVLVAKKWSEIEEGDKIYWNGSIAGYQLDTNDNITIEYLIQ